MMMLQQWVHCLAALVVLAEALNKIERVDPLQAGLGAHERLVEVLKTMAWLLLAFGAGVALAAPLLISLGWPGGYYQTLFALERPTLADASVMLGFAVLIVRTRVKEG